MALEAVRRFFRLEASGGVILLIAAIIAVILDNSALAWLYDSLLGIRFEIRLGTLELAKPLVLWINDGLMAVFFFLVGLEIKREILEGELSNPAQIALPLVAAVGGMAVPSGIYAFLNWDSPVELTGWAIPAATDIAFALGILMLLGNRVPVALKVFLLAVAIFDDLGAIIIIAIFFTQDVSLTSMVIAFGCLAVAIIMNKLGVVRIAAYILIGIVMWVSVLKSGVHATLAGVALAMTIPLRAEDEHGASPLKHLEHVLHPWVAFMVLPVFAFANAGVNFSGMTFNSLLEPVSLGIWGGLFVGKQIGIFGCTALMIITGLARMPEGCNWRMMYGVALLCGIGFTMSLFIGGLAFDDQAHATSVRLGVITGSILSGVAGYLVIRFSLGDAKSPVGEAA